MCLNNTLFLLALFLLVIVLVRPEQNEYLVAQDNEWAYTERSTEGPWSL